MDQPVINTLHVHFLVYFGGSRNTSQVSKLGSNSSSGWRVTVFDHEGTLLQ